MSQQLKDLPFWKRARFVVEQSALHPWKFGELADEQFKGENLF